MQKYPTPKNAKFIILHPTKNCQTWKEAIKHDPLFRELSIKWNGPKTNTDDRVNRQGHENSYHTVFHIVRDIDF